MTNALLRFHQRRQRLYTLLAKGTQYLIVLAGLAILVPALEGQQVALAWAIVGLALLEPVVGFLGLARRHRECANAIAAEMALADLATQLKALSQAGANINLRGSPP